jgi:hypothetical protein
MHDKFKPPSLYEIFINSSQSSSVYGVKCWGGGISPKALLKKAEKAAQVPSKIYHFVEKIT